MSVKILSNVETSCTTNAQKIEAMELEGYSWSTCSKQPRLVNCRTGVVNKLDRRRRRDLLITWSTCCGEIVSKSGNLGQSLSRKYLNFRWYPNFLITQCRIGGKKPPCQKQLDLSSHFDTIPACDRQTDRRTHDDSIYSASIASRGKNTELCCV